MPCRVIQTQTQCAVSLRTQQAASKADDSPPSLQHTLGAVVWRPPQSAFKIILTVHSMCTQPCQCTIITAVQRPRTSSYQNHQRHRCCVLKQVLTYNCNASIADCWPATSLLQLPLAVLALHAAASKPITLAGMHELGSLCCPALGTHTRCRRVRHRARCTNRIRKTQIRPTS
jgi:hypothetical protein